jgi:hypothetical protein
MSSNDQPSSVQPTALDEVLTRAEERIAALEDRLARVEGTSHTAPVMEGLSSRRGLFKLAGAVATGAVASTLVSASPAAAANGDALTAGNSFTSTADTTVTRSGTGGAALVGINNGTGATDGVKGVSNGVTGAGISGESTSGFGVYGSSTSGYALYAGGSGRLGMATHVTSGPPISGSYAPGDIIADSEGSLWTCATGGTPGQWVRISERATPNALPSGVTTLFRQAARDYVSLSTGPIVPGSPRIVKLPSLPRAAKGAIISATIVSPTAWASAFPASGYISIVAGGGTYFIPSVNFIPGTLQNTSLAVSPVDAQQQVTMATVGAGGCHVILDVVGYFS